MPDDFKSTYTGVGYLDEPYYQKTEYLYQTPPTASPTLLSAYLTNEYTSFPHNGNTVDGFFAQYSAANPMPQTWDAFITAFRSYLGITGLSGPDDLNTSGALYQLALGSGGFKSTYGILSSNAYWSTLATQLGFANTDDLSVYLFEQAFSKYLQNYPFNTQTATLNGTYKNVAASSPGPWANNTLAVSGNWGDFQAQNVTMQDDFLAAAQAYGFSTVPQDLLTQIVYNALQKNGTWNEGYFTPDSGYNEYVKQVVAAYTQAIAGTINVGTTTVGASTSKVNILNRILELLIDMIDTLQKVAGVQSDRLTFLTSWQRAYTDLQNQVPTFVDGGNYVIGDISGGDTGRQKANQLDTAFVETLRNNRSVISDDAKSVQSTINNSSDAVQQQTSMATAILQTFATILAAIYK